MKGTTVGFIEVRMLLEVKATRGFVCENEEEDINFDMLVAAEEKLKKFTSKCIAGRAEVVGIDVARIYADDIDMSQNVLLGHPEEESFCGPIIKCV